jgi:hypothetical protein
MTASDPERTLLPSTNHTRYQSIGPTEPEDEVKIQRNLSRENIFTKTFW